MHSHRTIDLEACKILWKHKDIFFAFAALPILLDVIVFSVSAQEYIGISNSAIAEISRALKWFIALPLFSIAWVRHLINPSYVFGVKSYFKVDTKVGKYMLFSGIIFTLFLAWEYFYIFFDLRHDGLVVLLYYYYLSLPLIISFWVAFYFALPSILILPSVADHTSMTVANIFKKSAPYRRGFSWEIFAWLFLLLYVPNKAQSLGLDLIRHGSSTGNIPHGIFSIPLHILKSLLVYAITGIILNFATLFYMQCIKIKKS